MGDFAWVGEWLVQFLKSPVWTTPVQGFIDENCEIFEENDQEENKLEYTVKHKRFCELVDKLLTDSLEDLGVTSEQFLEVVASSENPQLDQLVREYLLSLDDFLTFRKMMEKRNIELELEAMCALETADSAEDHLLEMAIKASVMENGVAKKENQAEDAALQHALAASLAAEEEKQRRLEEEIREKAASQEQEKKEVELAKQVYEERIRTMEEENLQARIEAIQRAPDVQEALPEEMKEIPKEPEPAPAPKPEPTPEPAKAKEPEKKPEPAPAPVPTPAPAPAPVSEAKPTAAAAAAPPAVPPPKAMAPTASPADKPHLAPIGQSIKTNTTSNDIFAKKPKLPGMPPGINANSRPSYNELKTAVVEQAEKKAAAENPSAPEPPKPVAPSDDDMKRREEYLRSQRDRLIQQRKEARESALTDYVKEKTGTAPAPTEATTAPEKNKNDEAFIEMRRALANKVKEDLLMGH